MSQPPNAPSSFVGLEAYPNGDPSESPSWLWDEKYRASSGSSSSADKTKTPDSTILATILNAANDGSFDDWPNQLAPILKFFESGWKGLTEEHQKIIAMNLNGLVSVPTDTGGEKVESFWYSVNKTVTNLQYFIDALAKGAGCDMETAFSRRIAFFRNKQTRQSLIVEYAVEDIAPFYVEFQCERPLRKSATLTYKDPKIITLSPEAVQRLKWRLFYFPRGFLQKCAENGTKIESTTKEPTVNQRGNLKTEEADGSITNYTWGDIKKYQSMECYYDINKSLANLHEVMETTATPGGFSGDYKYVSYFGETTSGRLVLGYKRNKEKTMIPLFYQTKDGGGLVWDHVMHPIADLFNGAYNLSMAAKNGADLDEHLTSVGADVTPFTKSSKDWKSGLDDSKPGRIALSTDGRLGLLGQSFFLSATTTTKYEVALSCVSNESGNGYFKIETHLPKAEKSQFAIPVHNFAVIKDVSPPNTFSVFNGFLSNPVKKPKKETYKFTGKEATFQAKTYEKKKSLMQLRKCDEPKDTTVTKLIPGKGKGKRSSEAWKVKESAESSSEELTSLKELSNDLKLTLIDFNLLAAFPHPRGSLVETRKPAGDNLEAECDTLIAKARGETRTQLRVINVDAFLDKLSAPTVKKPDLVKRFSSEIAKLGVEAMLKKARDNTIKPEDVNNFFDSVTHYLNTDKLESFVRAETDKIVSSSPAASDNDAADIEELKASLQASYPEKIKEIYEKTHDKDGALTKRPLLKRLLLEYDNKYSIVERNGKDDLKALKLKKGVSPKGETPGYVRKIMRKVDQFIEGHNFKTKGPISDAEATNYVHQLKSRHQADYAGVIFDKISAANRSSESEPGTTSPFKAYTLDDQDY